MKSSRPVRESAHDIPPVSPRGKIRKSSEERKEQQKIESTLKSLLGFSDDISKVSQLDLVLSAIAYIRELQQQLETDQENLLPEGFEQLFEKSVTA